MLKWRSPCWVVLGAVLALGGMVAAQPQAGSIRGLVRDKEFDAPLAAAQVTIVESDRKTTTTDQGNFVLGDVPPGKYTLVFSKEGYVRQVKADVVVSAGRLTEVNVALSGEFTEMEEFIVQDLLQLTPGSEAALLQLRFESPSLMDSISSDVMGRAGASDAASALRLVPGASVQNGKTAVIRGLPDRYVSSQMNGVRLPTADEDKRAVELDQFPAAVIESIQVSKTFTPDQQGDASGGAVNVWLKGIPEETSFTLKAEYGLNSQVAGAGGHFLTYHGGGVDFWGMDDGGRGIQYDNLGRNWEGAVGASTGHAPVDYKFSMAGGHKHTFDNGVVIGGFASLFYERDSAFYDNGIDDSYWVETPGGPLTPETFQGSAQGGDFKTGLFDVTRGKEAVRWGGLGTFGIKTEHHTLGLTYLYTRTAEDSATLAEDTRGKAYFFPGYDPANPSTPGHSEPDAAPYVRFETLEYTERTTQTLQLNGRHTFAVDGLDPFRSPELDWSVAYSTANSYQPDKRQFGSVWYPGRQSGPIFIPATHRQYKPAANFNLGNLQRIWKEIEEDSKQGSVNLKLPFEPWSESEGYVKLGLFHDRVDRTFDQDTFSNFNDNSSYQGEFNQRWSRAFPFENHPITESFYDVDYQGDLQVSAGYGMVDLPIASWLNLVGGVRFETTRIGIENDPERDAKWYPPGATAPVQLKPGDGDVSFRQSDVLPSIGLVYEPLEQLTLRGSFSETVARQTFKELTPILQQEYLGGPIFIGNPDLGMSRLKNYDLRVDYRPLEGSLISVSWFRKDIKDPIEYVQRIVDFTYTTAVNYPRGRLSGFEFELRQPMRPLWDALDGLALGANATFIKAKVTLPDDEQAGFNLPNILAPMSSRDMTDAPEHLYNLYLTYDLAATRTQLGLFYTVQGDTLLAGAGQAVGNFVPSVYAREYGTLNLSISQGIGKYLKLKFQAKNLTDPEIETVYRSKYVPGGDTTRTSYTKGIDYSISVSADIPF